MSNEYVRNPSEVVKPGDDVEVVVLDIDRKKRQIRFSMKAAEAIEVVEDEEPSDAPLPTAMEIAFRQAMQASDEAPGAAGRGGRSLRQRDGQEEILSRTLRGRARATSSEQ
jgi:transcriptional accessory protein Tex/SPT6